MTERTPEAVHPLSAAPTAGEYVRDCIYGLRHQPEVSKEAVALILERDVLPLLDAARTPDPDALREALGRVTIGHAADCAELMPRDGRCDCGLPKVRAALAAGVQPVPSEPEYDEDGDPIRPDPHSADWYDGYATAMRDVEAAPVPTDTPGADK